MIALILLGLSVKSLVGAVLSAGMPGVGVRTLMAAAEPQAVTPPETFVSEPPRRVHNYGAKDGTE